MKTQQVNVQLNLGGAIFLVLLILKLAKVITWSWWIVFLPIWLPILVMAGVLFILGVVAFGKYIFK